MKLKTHQKQEQGRVSRKASPKAPKPKLSRKPIAR